MKLETWFATPIWYDYTVFNFDSVAEKCKEISQTHPHRTFTNVGGWQSTDFDMDQYRELKPVKKIIAQKVDEFAKSIGPKAKLEMSNAWLNINQRGDYNSEHYHPFAIFSGVIYISVNEDSGNIEFNNNTAILHYQEVLNDDSGLFYRKAIYKPRNGMILIFPAWTPHSVSANRSNEPRISISFNIKQI